MKTSRGTLAWLGHPVTVVALAVLVINDHVLKAAYPGWVTGKLSDAAGLVLAPPLLAVICRLRGRWVAIVAVGVVFGIVKTVPYAAELASSAWSLVWSPSLVRADPADLLALPFLGLAAWSWRDRREAGRRTRAVRMAVLLPLALLGVAATSQVPAPPTAVRVAHADDSIYLAGGEADDPGRAIDWSRSTDGGRTWTSVAEGDIAALEDNFTETSKMACSPSIQRTCYRVIPGAIGVQVTTDGGATWLEAWRVSDRDRELLIERYDSPVDPGIALVSQAVIVHDVDGGYVVVVANGQDGFARMSVGGLWERIGFPGLPGPDAEALPELGERGPVSNAGYAVLAALILLLAGLPVTVGGAWALSRGNRGFTAWWVAPPVLLGTAIVLFATVGGEPVIALAGSVLGVLGTLVVTALLTWRVLSSGPDRLWWAVFTWSAGALTAVIQAIIWIMAWPGTGEPGTLTALLALSGCLPGLVVAALAAHRVRPS